MANIASLAVQLTANTGRFTSGMRSAINPVKSFQNVIGGLTSGMAGFWGAIAGGVSVGAIAAFTKRSLDSAEQLGVLSDRLNISTENLQSMKLAAKKSNIEFDSLVGGIEKFSKVLGMAYAGSTQAQKAFTALGLDVNELANMDANDAINETVSAINSLGTASERALGYTLVFGKSGQQLAQLFGDGGQAIDDAKTKLDAWGLSMSRIDSAKADLANDKFDELSFILSTIGEVFAVEVAPFIESAIQKFIEAGNAGDSFGNKALDAVEMLVKGISYIGDAWQVVQIAVNSGQLTIIFGFKALIDVLDEVYYKLQQVASFVPGTNIKPERALKPFSDALDDQLQDIAKKQKELINEPWSHEKVKSYFDDIRKKSTEAAEQQIGDNRDIGASLEDLYSKAEKIGTFQQGSLRDVAALQMNQMRGTDIASVAQANGVNMAGKQQSVRDPQLEITNKYLQQIANNTEEPTAVAA